MNATILPQSLIRALTQAPAWQIQKEYSGVLFLVIQLPREAEPVLGPLHELVSVQGEPLIAPSELINTLEIAKIDPKRAASVLTGSGRVELFARLGNGAHFALPLLKRRPGEPRARITVGRAPNNDVVLAEPSVSGQHAWFELDEYGSLMLQDARSKNGTVVNGRRLAPDEVSWIQPMDQLQFGSLSTFTCTPAVLRGVLKTLQTEPT